MRNHLFRYLQQYPTKRLLIQLSVFSVLLILLPWVADKYQLSYRTIFIVGTLLVWPGAGFTFLAFYAKLSDKNTVHEESKILRVLAGALFLLSFLSPFLYLWAIKSTA
jgi:hypothetical protein